MTRLLIGYDDSESARAAILVARSLFGPVDATIAHVHPPAPTVFVRRGRRSDGLAPADTRTPFSWSLTGHAR